MVSCAVETCRNTPRMNKNREPHKKLKFFAIPSVIRNQCDITQRRSERRRSVWLSRINRSGVLDCKVKLLRVCSEHFISGVPSLLFQEDNTDWAPSVNLGTVDAQVPCDNVSSSSGVNSPKCQLSPSLKLNKTILAPVQTCNQISPKSSTSNELSVALPKAGSCTSPPPQLSAGSGISILKPKNQRPLSSPGNGQKSSVSPRSHTSASSILNPSTDIFSPLKLSRNNTSEVKCYKRQFRKTLLSESDRSTNIRAGNNNSSSATSDTPVLADGAPQDALTGNLLIERAEYESLKAKLEELEGLRLRNRKFRDIITELEVDKMELKEKLKSTEEIVSHTTNIIKNMEEDFRQKEKERLLKIMENHEKLLKKRDCELEKVKKEAMQADSLTFRKLEIFSLSDPKVKFYTGLTNHVEFDLLLTLVHEEVAFEDKKFTKLLPWQNLVMILMRLRLGLLMQDLGYRFGVSVTTAQRTCDLWLDALFQALCLPGGKPLDVLKSKEYLESHGNSEYRIIKSIKPANLLIAKDYDKIVCVCYALTQFRCSLDSNPDLNRSPAKECIENN